MNYYSDWLEKRPAIDAELTESPVVARDSEIEWVETAQDARAKLLVGVDLGFATMGSNVVKAEIPVGWMTGMHSHGEEAMFILQGEGCSIIDGNRYNWRKHSSIHIPFGLRHQHFNTGDVP